MSFGLLGNSQYLIRYGKMLNINNESFPEYFHFNGNNTLFLSSRPDAYNLLNYYTYSTSSEFLEVHFSHHFDGFFFNKFPLIRRAGIQLVGSVNYLTTPHLDNYIEVGIGVEHIFKIVRVDYFKSFNRQLNQSSGIRIGFGF